MRSPLMMLSIVFLMMSSRLARADDQISKVDTLIMEPVQAGDLPDVVVTWLKTRELMIPYYGEYGYGIRYGNTLTGSFTGDNSKDCAVLTIPRGALEDSCSLWVFSSCDTLAPMLIAKHRVYRQGGSQWQKSYDKQSELEYLWCIRPFGPYSESDLRQMQIDREGLPKITHQGIFVLQAEKDPYPYYYYNGNEWIMLPLGE
jgi:hypothetical protein